MKKSHLGKIGIASVVLSALALTGCPTEVKEIIREVPVPSECPDCKDGHTHPEYEYKYVCPGEITCIHRTCQSFVNTINYLGGECDKRGCSASDRTFHILSALGQLNNTPTSTGYVPALIENYMTFGGNIHNLDIVNAIDVTYYRSDNYGLYFHYIRPIPMHAPCYSDDDRAKAERAAVEKIATLH